MKKTIVILLLAILGGTHAYSQTELYGTSLRIGKIGDIGNKNVPVGGLTQQYNIHFTGYRDVRPDQVGARISALRFNYYAANVPYIQNTGLAFYTNPKGNESGDIDLQERMRILPNGNIGIGTTKPTEMLEVAGTIRAREVKIEINAGADYVFEEDYELRPLSQVKGFIKDNKHLPDISSEKEMQENGLNVNEFQINLLKEVEELTLYIIQQDDKINKLEKELVKLKSED
ncbi:hypothetical protein E2605_01295 [Dysgonomonas capnocytophagoides]|uniref:Tail fiber domain-containing protein n=1 Tax=Dysgonomonas capnocytophagoides TaxID=45254 RepID=A0A4Y8LCH9_9BACT|nr:hypothetical protein [Dysgonomonas capnocytophagoides]TFD98750.1 hypothetical protein E2605_01295 [Dysgonomonas capnocytophagoides]